MDRYEKARLAIKDLPGTFYPGLMSELLFESHKKMVWKNGSALEFVKQTEKRIKTPTAEPRELI